MARRAGKAASRKARQRNVPKTLRTPAPRPAPLAPTADDEAATPVPPVGTPDMRQATSLTPPRRVTPPLGASAKSALTDRERAEFHYVERDLRSLGVLTAVLAVLLVVAWVIFNALGLTA